MKHIKTPVQADDECIVDDEGNIICDLIDDVNERDDIILALNFHDRLVETTDQLMKLFSAVSPCSQLVLDARALLSEIEKANQ